MKDGVHAFWSYTFNNFEQIRIPNKKVFGANPHAFLDFKLFTASQIADDLHRQSEVLKEFVDSENPVYNN